MTSGNILLIERNIQTKDLDPSSGLPELLNTTLYSYDPFKNMI